MVELEQENEDLTERVRIQTTSEEYAKEQHEALLEDKIFLKQELEERTREFEDKEARLNATIEDHVGDISALKAALASFQRIEIPSANGTKLGLEPLRVLSGSPSAATEINQGAKKKLCLQIRGKNASIAKFVRMVQETDEVFRTKDTLAQLENLDEYLKSAEDFSNQLISAELSSASGTSIAQ